MSKSPTTIIVLALLIVLLVGGGSYAISRYVISGNSEKGKGLAEQRAAERSRQQGATSRNTTLTRLLTSLEDSLQTRPLDSMLLISAANISYDLEQFDKAARYYEMFLKEIDPSNAAIRIDYAYSLYKTGKQAAGKSVLEGIIQRDPRNQAALLNLAVMFAQDRQFDEALKWFTRCRDTDPASDLGKRAAMAIAQLQSNT